jgi:hypothetical protein
MPQDRPLPGSAEDWLARAEGDLALARAPLPEGAFYEDLCFHALEFDMSWMTKRCGIGGKSYGYLFCHRSYSH